MDVTRDIAATRRALAIPRARGDRIGLVPTMGALHAGHIELLATACQACDFSVATIFVNPTQFAADEDLAAYPRTPEQDYDVCRAAGIDLVFQPTAAEMYRPDASTTVTVAGLDRHLCGPHRPGHFVGVATVVAKLFQIVQPDAAYFGRKDYQQLAIIRRMVRDLDMPVDVVGCPTVREADGLALSSRNVYLSDEHRRQAAVIPAALRAVAERIAAGQTGVPDLTTLLADTLRSRGPLEIDYASIVDPDTLQPLETVAGPVVVAAAVRIGQTRLIDNLEVDPPATGD